MPMRCTEAARCSGIRNRWQGRTHTGKPDNPDRTSGPEPVPPSKPSRSSKSPKPECASEPPSVDARGWRADRPKIERREVPENQKTAAEMPSSGTCFSVRRFARAADLQGGRRAEMPAINRSRGRAFADRHQPRRGNPACANACIRPENTIEGTAPAGSQPTVLTVRLA